MATNAIFPLGVLNQSVVRATAGADNQPAIQTALNAAGAGGVVYLDAAYYRIDSALTVPDGVSLVGTWRGMPSLGPGSYDLTAYGTVIGVNYGSGTTTGQTITLNMNSRVEGFGMKWVGQGVGGVSTVLTYPYAIGTSYGASSPDNYQSAGGCVVRNVCLFNAYTGIAMRGAYRFLIDNVLMDVSLNGLFVDTCYDTSWVNGLGCTVLSVAHGWSDFSAQQAYKVANLTAVRVARADSLNVNGLLVYAALVGVSLEQSPFTPTGGLRTPWVYFRDATIDVCDVCIDAQYTQTGGYGGNFIGGNCHASGGSNNLALRAGASCGSLCVMGMNLQSDSTVRVSVAGGAVQLIGNRGGVTGGGVTTSGGTVTTAGNV